MITLYLTLVVYQNPQSQVIDEYINKLASVSFIIIKYLIVASCFGKGSQNPYSQSYKYKGTRCLY